MLQRNTDQSPIQLSDMPNGAFFRIVSSTAAQGLPEYESKLMISIFDADLPRPMRLGNDTSALFVVLGIVPGAGVPTRIIVRQIDFDLPDSTMVVRNAPVSSILNGCEISLHQKPVSSTDFHSLRIGRINEQGELKKRSRSHGRDRPRGGRG